MTTNNQKLQPGHQGYQTHFFFVLLTAACIAFALWAMIGKLDIVSRANGKVVPSSRVKHIQHLEGGIVREIKVREGETVKKDQVLAVLEQIATGADVDELSSRIISLQFDILRLEAENNSQDTLIIPTDLKKTHSDLARQSQNLFQARQDRLEARNEARKEVVPVHRKADHRDMGFARRCNVNGVDRLIGQQRLH